MSSPIYVRHYEQQSQKHTSTEHRHTRGIVATQRAHEQHPCLVIIPTLVHYTNSWVGYLLDTVDSCSVFDFIDHYVDTKRREH